MQLTGIEASLRWGYTSAARLGAWTVVTEGGQATLTATILSQDTFRISQRPLVFEATHAKGAWRWSVASLQLGSTSLTATLGPCEG